MKKEEFKARWESNENGGGITFEDMEDCAKEWGIAAHPCTMHILKLRYKVLSAANVIDAELYNYVDA